MKFISWNVNGIRAAVEKGFLDYFQGTDADFFSLQETKCQENQISLDLPGYFQYWNSAERKGYSGTAVFTKHEPMGVIYDLGIEHHDKEGRVITLEYQDFYLVNVYTPNSGEGLKRLEYRLEWERDFREYLGKLSEKKGVIL
ncbi:MAG: exodeoxyribonuclease III, partial [Fusobacteriaceae bacterium]